MKKEPNNQAHIVTSYFAQSKKLTAAGYTIISICRYNPKWIRSASYKPLAPSARLLKEWIEYHDEHKYTTIFNNNLHENLNPGKVLEDLLKISDGKPIALCCYERPADFCHRHLVAEWMNQALGLQIEEFHP